MQTEFKEADVEQQKLSEDVPRALPAVKKADPLQATGDVEITNLPASG